MSVSSDPGVTLALYKTTFAPVNRLASSTGIPAKATLTFTNRGAGRAAFLVVTPGRGVRSSTYTASVSVK